MNTDLMKMLACPDCVNRPPLDAGDITAGPVCRACGRRYPIIAGVPRFVQIRDPENTYVSGFGFQWKSWHDSGFEPSLIYGKTEEQEAQEFFKYLGIAPSELDGKVVLDAGCGSGRLTRYLGEHGAFVVGLDMHPGLDVVAEYCSKSRNVLIVHGDILKIPVAKGVADIVWSDGVIHHTPDPGKAFDMLASTLRPGGRMYVWVYWKEEMNVYRRVRRALRIAHRLPGPMLYSLCYCIATAMFVGACIRKMFAGFSSKRRLTSIRHHALRLFDHLSPEYNSQHTEEEVRGWFARNGLVGVTRVADLGMRGDKPR